MSKNTWYIVALLAYWYITKTPSAFVPVGPNIPAGYMIDPVSGGLIRDPNFIGPTQ